MHCLFENTVFLAHIGRSGLQKGPGKQGEGPKKHHDKEAALKETLRDAPCHWQTGQGSKKHARNACQGVVHNTFGHKACQHIKPCGKGPTLKTKKAPRIPRATFLSQRFR